LSRRVIVQRRMFVGGRQRPRARPERRPDGRSARQDLDCRQERFPRVFVDGRVPERALDRVCARGQRDCRQLSPGHSLGSHDRAVGRITDRNDPRPRLPRPGRASGFGPHAKRPSNDVQPAYQLRWTRGDQRLAYPWPFRRRAAAHGIHPRGDGSPMPTSTGSLCADRLDLRSLDTSARKSQGAAGSRRPFSRDGEHEAGQPWDSADVRLSRSADSADGLGPQAGHQEHRDSERKIGTSYVPRTEARKLIHTQSFARRRAIRRPTRAADGGV
jgi:hypothetical protein